VTQYQGFYAFRVVVVDVDVVAVGDVVVDDDVVAVGDGAAVAGDDAVVDDIVVVVAAVGIVYGHCLRQSFVILLKY